MKLTLVFSDVMLALLVWEVACLVKVLLSPGSLSGAAGASIVVPITLLCVGMRAMQRLYASCYGLDEAEELKRQSYVLLATLAFAAIFALAFQVGDMVSRLLLALVFTGLLVLSPLERHYVKTWMMGHGGESRL